jgi:hypothetical protein
MSKNVSLSKNKQILNLANRLIVENTEAGFFTKMCSDDGGNHLCIYIDETAIEDYNHKKVGSIINENFPRLRICNFFVSSDYIETFLR